MDNLVTANLKQRPVRTIISVIGVALGVVLIILMVGLSNGVLQEQGRRNSNVGAELLFTRPNNYGPGTSSVLALPVQYGPKIAEITGVQAVSPVGQYLKPSNQSFGMEMVEGIDIDTYQKVTNLKISQGETLNADDEVIVDPIYSKDKKVKIGDKIDLFGHKFRVAGIYQPEIGARIKIKLSMMQNLLGSKERCSFVYVKCQPTHNQEEVAAGILTALPGNKVLFTREIQGLYEKGLPAINVFVKAVVVVSIIISVLVIMLAMYTTITERTREIGVLKSLGASRRFIIFEIEKEALLISVLGTLLGYLVAISGRWLLIKNTSLIIELEPKWLFYAALVGVLSGLLGALYPALRVANQDPVKALSYE